MSTLYVTEPGVQVHKTGGRLLVKRGGDTLQDIPLIKVDRVVLMGRGVSITTPALYALTRQRVGVYYLNSRGRFILRTIGDDHRHSRLRVAQAKATDDPSQMLLLASSIVDGKINNQRVLVQRHAEGAPWARKSLSIMDGMRRKLDSAQNLDEIRGYEGAAAKGYFSILRKLLHPPRDGRTWGFERRSYRPPPDPVNALLSFGYTLLLNDMVAACQLAGLDPDLGVFHSIDYNKPAMALDLAEEFRPIIVDSIVLTAINRPIFGLRDFEIAKPGKRNNPEGATHPQNKTTNNQNVRPVNMKNGARKQFIGLYEARVNEHIYYPPSGSQLSYRRIFELQAYAMAAAILGEKSHYTPFTVR